jgi:hypothetical protein
MSVHERRFNLLGCTSNMNARVNASTHMYTVMCVDQLSKFWPRLGLVIVQLCTVHIERTVRGQSADRSEHGSHLTDRMQASLSHHLIMLDDLSLKKDC